MTNRKILTAIALLAALSIPYIFLFGPLSHGKERVSELRNIESESIESIRFMPSNAAGTADSTLSRTYEVSDRERISQLCESIKSARESKFESIRNPEVKALVEIRFADSKHLSLGLVKDGSVCILRIGSSGDKGWIYANLYAAEFGRNFDSITQAKK